MKPYLRLIAMALCLCLLTGCGLIPGSGKPDLAEMGLTAYSDMIYARPDMDQLELTLKEALEAAAGTDFEKLIQSIYAFFDAYDLFFTHYSLADLRYSADLTDAHWEEECDFLGANSPRVDAMLEELYYALAKSPWLEELESEEYFGPGYFDSYQGENNWDAEFTALLQTQSDLVSRYYELSATGAEYEPDSESYYAAVYDDMAELLIELVKLRHHIAEYWGYEDYSAFSFDYTYYRDYPVADSREYMDRIRQELVPLYRQVNESDFWQDAFPAATEEDTYKFVARAARKMGGVISEAFYALNICGLHDIGYGENKYPSSFEVYLASYDLPFVFMSPSMTTYDYLTFAHEFGHFCADYAAYGSYAGMDVQEFFSQGMEYLSLCYGEAPEALIRAKMADSLCLYVEQSAYAQFEMALYGLPEEALTAENIRQLYRQVGESYGLDSIGFDDREFVTITHYYTNPLYILSYVVSNDAALQLYQLERANAGSGLACLEENLATQEYCFLSFLNAAGLESPFSPGRLEAVRRLFEEVLG